MPLTLNQPIATPTRSPSFYAGRRLSEFEKRQLWQWLQAEPESASRWLRERLLQGSPGRAVSVRHLNRLRAAWGLSRRRGRPRQRACAVPSGEGELIALAPRLSFVGVHLFGHWLDQQAAFTEVVERLEPAIETYSQTHPEEDFPLLHHRQETLRRRFQALFFAPLFGIQTLTEFDRREHALPTLIGRGYQSTTLNQFLAQLERLEAGAALMPTLSVAACGQINYVDGHMIAYWNRVAMHKGKITMLGRIMAGSQAVITHDETGQARFAEYYPPDIHLSQLIVAYCQKVSGLTGSSLFVIDRAVNSVALAVEFTKHQLGLLSMLDDNEYQGLTSFNVKRIETLDDGTEVYSGHWKVARPDDPRQFVITVPVEGKPLVYWATEAFVWALAMNQWPSVYRARNEIQENRFKRMIEHGALNTNYGRKKLIGPDRHQQRQKEALDQALQSTAQKRDKKAQLIEQQQRKVRESQTRGHGKRLAQRQRTLHRFTKEDHKLQKTQQQLAEKIEALGPPRQRADRDFRKQSIMTFRTLLLENTLHTFLATVCALLTIPVSLAALLSLLFERRGARVETPTELLYWLNTQGLSLPNRRLLAEIAEALCAMDLRHQGKPIRVCLRDRPP
jgi:hypothetical protein